MVRANCVLPRKGVRGNDPDPFAEPTDDELLSNWELEFLASMELWSGEPTEAQQAKLDEIEEALAIRRRHWRDGWFPRYVR